LDVTVPCCGSTVSLNDLDYDWPAGFARFVVEARNPRVGNLSDAEMRELELIVRTRLRPIRARY
jgi:hypothetical protein